MPDTKAEITDQATTTTTQPKEPERFAPAETPAVITPESDAPVTLLATPVLPQDVPAKKPICPICKSNLVVYVGDNLHKLSTAFCERCGVRHHLKG